MDSHNQDVRFTLPDPVLDAPERERTPGIWMSHADARSSVMMQVPNLGAFVRALLPVKLTGGFAVTFGVWLGVHPDEMQRAFRVWWEPEYADLVIDGRLANALPGWGLLAAPVRAVVRDPEETPYCADSSDEVLAAVLTDEWPHDRVLDAISDMTGGVDPHTASYVCTHVLAGERPVLFVYREGEDWALLCGDEHSDEGSVEVVGIGHVLDADETLGEILDLEPGQEAERDAVGGAWTRTKP